ncbi:MAG: tyrosine-type recombinase/integrase [Gammaproteobacteria bacterium]|nr:tyrosine-type recombinase/integrase [Gammaproteobacteria bacterium]
MKANDEKTSAPRGPFTIKYLLGLKAREKRYEVIEPGRTNLRMLVAPSGSKTFYYVYKHQGERIYLRLAEFTPRTDLADVRARLRQLADLRDKGVDPRASRVAERELATTAINVTEFAKRFLERYAMKRKRSWRQDERILRKNVVPEWGTRAVRSIERADVRDLIEKIATTGGPRAVPNSGIEPATWIELPTPRRTNQPRKPAPAPVAANRTLACLRVLFNYAIDQDIIEHNPCARVKMATKERPRERWLPDPELRAFWAGLQGLRRPRRKDEPPTLPPPCAALAFMLVTGQRKGEVIGMTWREVDLDGAWWTIPETRAKNGRAHRVPLSPLALQLLDELAGLSRTFVFPGRATKTHIRDTSVDHTLRDHRDDFVLDGKPLDPFTPHDLRRTVATHLARLGTPRLVISNLLNHTEGGVTTIYDRHSYEREKRLALDAWSRHLVRVIAGEVVTDDEVSQETGNVVEFPR